jgi:hypothetical protein
MLDLLLRTKQTPAYPIADAAVARGCVVGLCAIGNWGVAWDDEGILRGTGASDVEGAGH